MQLLPSCETRAEEAYTGHTQETDNRGRKGVKRGTCFGEPTTRFFTTIYPKPRGTVTSNRRKKPGRRRTFAATGVWRCHCSRTPRTPTRTIYDDAPRSAFVKYKPLPIPVSDLPFFPIHGLVPTVPPSPHGLPTSPAATSCARPPAGWAPLLYTFALSDWVSDIRSDMGVVYPRFSSSRQFSKPLRKKHRTYSRITRCDIPFIL